MADVIAGTLLALAAHAMWLRSCSPERVPELDRRLAPFLALCVTGIVGLGVACFWVAYLFRSGV